MVAASLASGLAAALVLNRQRRRRGYRPQPPQPLAVTAAPPLPSALRRLLAAGQDDLSLGGRDGDNDLDDPDEPTTTKTDDQQKHAASPRRLPDVQVGHRAGKPVTLNLLAQPGLAAAGDGAQGVLRHLLVTLLSTARPYELELRVIAGSHQVLLPVGNLEAVHRADTLDRALLELQTAVLTRTRRFLDAGTPTFEDYRREHPEDPLPLLILVTGASPQMLTPALTAILATGQPLGVTAVVLGDAHRIMGQLTIAADGTISGATPGALQTAVDGVQLFRLSEAEAVAALEVLSDDQPPGAALDRADVAVHQQQDPETDSSGGPALRPAPTAFPAAGPVTVQVLGRYTISAWGEQITSGLRRSAKELLVYFLLHPAGASAETAMAALWPEIDGERGRERFWTAMSNLRTRLRNPEPDKGKDDDSDVAVIARHGEHYRIPDGMLTVDLWNFQAALTDASHAASASIEAQALTRAADIYHGDLAGEVDYWWAETAREELHRSALHTLVRLAELHSSSAELPAAIDYLQRAMRLDPHAEAIHRRLIQALTTGGRDDEALRCYRQLAGRLADIDLEPDETTERLVAELGLLSRPQARRRQEQARQRQGRRQRPVR